VLQTSTTSTTYYPNKYYSLTSTKSGANTYATSTNYIFNGDTLLATIDQALYNGAATGSPITRYIHPDHLGSTNVVTDQNGALVQLMDYYPYGATRIATSTYPTNEKRQYIGQYYDTGTSLSYLNARYYDSPRGQFTSEDPIFLGDPSQQNILDPRSLNTYSYANDNPIVKSDPNGKFAASAVPFIMYGAEGLGLGATVEFWGPPAVAGIITASTVALLSHGGGLVYAPSAPGFQQAVQLSRGSGYDTDPRFPLNKPPGRWGGFILTTIASAATLGAIEEVHDRISSMSSWTQQAQINNSYMQWACNIPTLMTQPQLQNYSDNYTYSLQTGKPSNLKNSATSSGGGSGGGGSSNSNYMTQTYQTPNGAIVDWGGNVIVPAPSSNSKR
jgi:RHS repeat-associated protein